jgi:hypothetical protein
VSVAFARIRTLVLRARHPSLLPSRRTRLTIRLFLVRNAEDRFLDLPVMPKAPSVFNATRGFYLRSNQARKAVENCACSWIEYGVSVRDLTLAESIAARVQQAKDREPLPYSEVHGLRFEPPFGTAGAEWQSRLLAYEATLFVGDIDGRRVIELSTGPC